MKIDIKIPSMGESVVEAIIGSLLKEEGALVKVDEELLEIETDKVNQVLYAPSAGIVHFSVKSGDTAKIGQTVGYIDTEGQAKEASLSSEKKKEENPPAPPEYKKAEPLSLVREEQPLPAAQGGAVEEVFAEASLQTSMPQVPDGAYPGSSNKEKRVKMTKLRRTIAERLVAVKNQTALLTTFNEIDLSSVIAVREREQENFVKKHGVKLGFMSFFIKACVSALQEFPQIHARIDQDDLVFPNVFDISVAVSTEKGLMVPVIRGADALSYAEIEKQLKHFAEKARNGSISVDDMQGGTFTITNGGVFGSLLSTPILNPPQSGILGMHSIVRRPIAVGDQVVIRPMMYVALSYDHRVVDGRDSILFLVSIKKNLEDPTRLLLDL